MDRPADLQHFRGSGCAAKVLSDFAKTNDKLVLKAGAMRARCWTPLVSGTGKSIPSREELLAKLLGVMQAPVSGFALHGVGQENAARRRCRLSLSQANIHSENFQI
jgi:hypothetical protein